VVIKCENVCRGISNYPDSEVGPELQLAIEEYLCGRRCAAVVAGTRNLIDLYGDERMQEVPSGFSSHLQQRLENKMLPNRRDFSAGSSPQQPPRFWLAVLRQQDHRLSAARL
jgi:hypothetical protein